MFAIVVAYESNLPRLDALLAALASQCGFILTDNSDGAEKARQIAALTQDHGGTYISMAGNKGVGAAQNAAITLAFESGAEAVLLLDDDSLPMPGLIARLSECRTPDGRTDAVFCALPRDENGSNISGARHRHSSLVLCRDMMSSGTLIRRGIFELVGPFDDGLFIDCVDFEWGWRASQLGIDLYLCRDVHITHRLGEGQIANVRFPSPVRHYYQYRNVLRMIAAPNTPIAWRVSQAIKLPVKLLLIALLMPQRGVRLRHAVAGIRDACMGRSGPLHTVKHTLRVHLEQ